MAADEGGRACPHSSQPGSHSEQRLFLSQSTVLIRRPWTWLLWERPWSRCFTPCRPSCFAHKCVFTRAATCPCSGARSQPSAWPAIIAHRCAHTDHAPRRMPPWTSSRFFWERSRAISAARLPGTVRCCTFPCGSALAREQARFHRVAGSTGSVDCDADLPGQGRHNRSGLPSRGQRCRAQRIFERSWMLGPATMNLP